MGHDCSGTCKTQINFCSIISFDFSIIRCEFECVFLPQGKIERPASYSTQPVRPVHDRLGVRHPNKTLNKTVMETSAEDKNEKVIHVVMIQTTVECFYLVE